MDSSLVKIIQSIVRASPLELWRAWWCLVTKWRECVSIFPRGSIVSIPRGN